ncbi:uncharacterized protein LOC135213572 [Macrobrachium nipponense]|uniref:uncharacterized protein LOC135213572 n=1 Tax=Macrobrachium nipponense TaxID=159736 RepID=UPI0030C81937
MRALVILVAVTYCSAQLVLPSAPWVLPGANLLTVPSSDAEVKSVPLVSPYIHPLTTPYLHPYGLTPYSLPLGHHLPYVVAADSTLKATEFPYVYEKVEASAAPAEEAPAAVEEARRRRRDVSVPLPYLHAVPTTKDITVETKQFEAIDAATPADTTKIELTTKEHELTIPAVKYVQPHVNLKPVTYTAVSPAVLPYTAAVSPAVLPYYAGYPALHLPGALASAPVVKFE